MKDISESREKRIAVNFGKKIKYLRERDGYSQQKLADLLECSSVTLQRVEKGQAKLKLWRMEKACRIFRVSLDYLLRDFDPDDLSLVPSYVVKLFHDADEVELEILSRQMMSADHMINVLRDAREKREF